MSYTPQCKARLAPPNRARIHDRSNWQSAAAPRSITAAASRRRLDVAIPDGTGSIALQNRSDPFIPQNQLAHRALRNSPYVVYRNFQLTVALLLKKPTLRFSRFGKGRNMARVYFHCSNTIGASIDRCGSAVADLAEAQEHAVLVVRSLIMTPVLADWRGWVLHVSDKDGEEIFTVPFASLLGKAH